MRTLYSIERGIQRLSTRNLMLSAFNKVDKVNYRETQRARVSDAYKENATRE